SHDGFTLYDLLAYDHKRNLANGHDNLDGTTENWSTNSGWEGDEGAPPDVLERRERRAKSLLALTLLSNGTPMLRAGDEFLQTQGGNNNPYNQDNATTWLDWGNRRRHAGFWRFVQQMIVFRKLHPSIARSRFWREDVRWFGPSGAVDLAQPQVAWRLDGSSQGDVDLYVMVNASSVAVTFEVADDRAGWRLVVDTARSSPDDIELERPRTLGGTSLVVEAHAVVMLVSSVARHVQPDV
ncbi:MAG TPA: hypothetical protein VGM39_08285, partial [Kofleriaceae bacterium]